MEAKLLSLDTYALSIIGLMTAVTFGLRALPFLTPLPSALVSSLRRAEAKLPTLFLALLTVYCLEKALTLPRGGVFSYAVENVYLLAASLAVAVVHALWGRLIFSLLAGTLLYLGLMNFL